MPKRKHNAPGSQVESAAAQVRSLWSGTITLGLVSIPVDLLTAVRPRQTATKLVDRSGHALGRRYYCSKEGKRLNNEQIVRGYETDGKTVVITDEEFESVAPEMSGDIELRNFVPLEQISPLYFQRPYFLTPAGKSAKAYNLLATTMERAGRVAIGSFVMRAHEYLVAIIPDNGVLRADTLRYADEIRTPEAIDLPKRTKAPANKVTRFSKAIEELTRTQLDMSQMQDEEAEALEELAATKEKNRSDVIHSRGLEEDADAEAGGAKIIDLMEVLRKSLSKNAVVTTANSGPPISLAERRARRAVEPAPKTATAKRKRKPQRKTSRASKAAKRA